MALDNNLNNGDIITKNNLPTRLSFSALQFNEPNWVFEQTSAQGFLPYKGFFSRISGSQNQFSKFSRKNIRRVIEENIEFFKALRLNNYQSPEELYYKYPSAYTAYEIYSTASIDYRWFIEALIIANEKVEKIADYLALPVDAIVNYELLYYNVRDKLKHEGFVLCTLFDSKTIKNNIDPYDPDSFWKLIAYATKDVGPDGLYTWWSIANDMPGHIEESFMRLYKRQREKLRLNALYSLRVNSHNAIDYLENDVNFTRVENEAKLNAIPTGQVDEQAKLGAVLNSIQWTVSRYSPELAKHLKGDELPPLMDYNTEPKQQNSRNIPIPGTVNLLEGEFNGK